MVKINKHIIIVSSSRRTISSMSQASRQAALAVLDQYYELVEIRLVDTMTDLISLVAAQPDLVFLGMKFLPATASSERVWLSQYLDEHNIAYTGSTQMAHEIEHDKPAAKQQAQEAGLNTSQFYVIDQGETVDTQHRDLDFPLFVKPVDRGGGVGIDSDSVVNNYDQLQTKVDSIRQTLGAGSLVERFLPGREFSVAIMQDETTDTLLALPLELIPMPDRFGKRILSQAVKSADTEKVLAVTDTKLRRNINQLALGIFKVLGARDYGRVDMRMDEFGVLQFLEANLIPSFIEGYGNFPKACVLNLGLDYTAMLLRIVNLGLSRQNDDVFESPIANQLSPAIGPFLN